MKETWLSALQNWIGAGPEADFRKAHLVKTTPVAETTLEQILRGRYVPSEMMANAIDRAVDIFRDVKAPSRKVAAR